MGKTGRKEGGFRNRARFSWVVIFFCYRGVRKVISIPTRVGVSKVRERTAHKGKKKGEEKRH